MERKFWWYVVRVLQIIWLSPAIVLVWFFYALPMWLIFRDLVFVRWVEFGIAEFVLAEKGLESWHKRLWRDWAGWAGPGFFIWVGDPHAPMSATRDHEIEHCRQQYRWGIFFYPVYFLESVWIWLFKRDWNAYLDNHFERAARRAAGQLVNIPPEWWNYDPDNRWPWW